MSLTIEAPTAPRGANPQEQGSFQPNHHLQQALLGPEKISLLVRYFSVLIYLQHYSTESWGYLYPEILIKMSKKCFY